MRSTPIQGNEATDVITNLHAFSGEVSLFVAILAAVTQTLSLLN